MTKRIIRCTDRHLERMLAFLSEYNPAAEHHIGYFGVTPEDIRQSVLMLNLRYNRGFRLAMEGGRLVGVMGVDFDKEINRAWLYGPVVIAEAWAETADALYAAVQSALPVEVVEHEIFVDRENVNCRAFAERHSFQFHGEMAIYFITPERLSALPEQAGDDWDDRFANQFLTLHEQLFPRSNYTLNYLLAEREKGATLLIVADGGKLAGYFFGRTEPESGEAYVDLIGIDPAYRGRGLGRRLMLAGLSRLRAMPNLHQVNLTVEGGNLTAMGLYESLGFDKERDMVAFRKRMEGGMG